MTTRLLAYALVLCALIVSIGARPDRSSPPPGLGWAYISFVTRLESLPEAIGYHWFRWADEPGQGRSDGENSNYGLVPQRDEAYGEFLDAVTATNHAAVEIHRGVPSTLQTSFFWRNWEVQDIPDLILGGPRWLSTAFRTV